MSTKLACRTFLVLVTILFARQAVSRSQTAAPAPQNAAQPQTADSTAIRQVLDTQQAAWNRGDIPAFLQGYWNSPDLTFSGVNGTVRGYHGLLDRYRKSYPNTQAMGQLEFSDLEIHPLGQNAALVLGKWHLTRSIGDLGGVFTLVFRRFPAGWRIIHDHTSTQKDAT